MNATQSTGRSAWALVCLIIGCLMIPASLVGLWAKDNLTSTEGFTELTAPLAHDQGLQQDVSRLISTGISNELNLEDRIGNLTGDGWLSDLIPADQIASKADDLVNNSVQNIVQQDQFAGLWKDSVSASHARTAAIFAEASGDQDLDGAGVLSFKVGDTLDTIIRGLTNLGIPGLDGLNQNEWDIQLIDASALPTVDKFFDLTNSLGLWLIYVAAALVIASALLDYRFVSIGLLSLGAVLLVLALALNTFFADYVASQLFTALSSDVADRMIQQLTSGLTGALVTGGVVSLLLGAASWPIIRHFVRQHRRGQLPARETVIS